MPYNNIILRSMPFAWKLFCAIGMLCVCSSCQWREAKEVIAKADSLDQIEHVIYDDTAALRNVIRCLDNPFSRVLMSNTLGKAYYYMGRNYSLSDQIAEAAECYIEADRLQIDDPIYRGRVNSCMGYICAQNNNDSLALIFYERASEDFKESGNEWYYAQMLLDCSERHINLHKYCVADSLLQIAQSYQLDNAYSARFYETRGLYFLEQQQYDSALVYFQEGLDYWQSKKDKCFSWLKMMQVYLAINEKANKPWAVKEVRKSVRKDFDILRQSLIVETDLLKRLNHPNLPSIVDVIDSEENFLIVMDYIEGITLDRMLQEHGEASQRDVVYWAMQLCDVLEYLHSRPNPIIYRDMKPSNIMLKSDGDVVLIDFGTAREYKEKNVADTTCLGTQGYAAPEQFGGMGQTDARTDIYCLGATMYHLLTGHNPSQPPYEMYPITHWKPELSSGLEKIVQKCTD